MYVNAIPKLYIFVVFNEDVGPGRLMGDMEFIGCSRSMYVKYPGDVSIPVPYAKSFPIMSMTEDNFNKFYKERSIKIW